MKKLLCRDLGFNCGHEIEAETEEEILNAAAQHALAEKHLTEITPEVVNLVRSAIKDLPVKHA